MQDHQRPFAVITGASRGIGAEYARALSTQGYDLLLVSRDLERLDQLAAELGGPAKAESLAMDLAQPEAGTHLHTALSHQKRAVDVLVHNAGFGLYGPFVTMPVPRIREMVWLHVNTVIDSTRLFLPEMVERRRGTVIFVSSLAGFLPVPYMALYSATKAFLIAFAEALAEEVRGSGIRIQACCPGYTQTEFHERAGVTPPNPFNPLKAHEVVAASLHGLHRHQTRVPVGWQGTFVDLISRCFPRPLLVRLTAKWTRRVHQG